MYWPSLRDRRVLGDHVTWAGDEAGAVVAAESEEIAEEALRLSRSSGRSCRSRCARRTRSPRAPRSSTRRSTPRATSSRSPRTRRRTSSTSTATSEAGFAAADVIVEVASRHHRADHGCLDTRGCLVRWQGGKLTCWTNLYQADQTRMHIAEMLDLPLNKVRVICPYVGGSFGRGNVGDQIFFIFTAILARRTRPARALQAHPPRGLPRHAQRGRLPRCASARRGTGA